MLQLKAMDVGYSPKASAGVRSSLSGFEGEQCSLGLAFAVPLPVFGVLCVGISAVVTLSLLVPSVQNERSSRGWYLAAPAPCLHPPHRGSCCEQETLPRPW